MSVLSLHQQAQTKPKDSKPRVQSKGVEICFRVAAQKVDIISDLKLSLDAAGAFPKQNHQTGASNCIRKVSLTSGSGSHLTYLTFCPYSCSYVVGLLISQCTSFTGDLHDKDRPTKEDQHDLQAAQSCPSQSRLTVNNTKYTNLCLLQLFKRNVT